MKHFVVRGIVAGIVMLIVSSLYMWLTNMFMPALSAEYANPSLFRPWTDPLMQSYVLYPFVLGIALAWAWKKLKPLSLTPVQFALGMLVVSGIPGMLISYQTFPVSFMMILSWLVSGFIDSLVAGYTFRMLDKR